VSVCGLSTTASTVVSDWPRTHGRALGMTVSLRTVRCYETGGRPTLTIRFMSGATLWTYVVQAPKSADTLFHTVAQSSRSLSAALTY